MADFSTIVTEVERYAGRTDDIANIRKAVNASIHRIESAANWYWMEQVATVSLPAIAPMDRVSLPTTDPPGAFKDLREEPFYADGSGGRVDLEPISEEEANVQYTDLDSGEPVAYRLWKDQLYIYPPVRATARTMTLSYWKWSLDLTGTNAHELISRWPELLVARACVEYMRANRDFKGAAYWEGDPRAPKPGTYMFELAMLKKYEARRKLPKALGARGDRFVRQRTSSGYPWWGR